ncbi:TPM domain-containing protein [Geobacter pelophilus]|uniref:TPM domain-containing protein n=1 Tax=Geoanaerobacter pelophilus TaxID=60036 RepID=A0AAW4L7L5_9BACT|nr:TPM domain-containing protein [Geoanaerobacter pelophilus]MBT0664570.1 TPM domain-containing protein [Geoanaerobacter pelophilus]
MKKGILLIFLGLILCSQFVAFAAAVPALQGRVNDYAGLLSPAAVQEVDGLLAGLEQSDSTQVVVLTVPTLEGEPVESFGIKVAEAWKIGQKRLDNGAILLIAKQERKIRIEVGRGLEGKLTDLLAGRIIRDEIAPFLKQGDFDSGIKAGVAAIAKVVRGEYQAQDKSRDLHRVKKGFHPSLTLLVFLLVAIVFLGSISRFLGGLAGAVGLPLAAFLSFSGIGIAMLLGLAVAGFVLGLIVVAIFGSGGGGFWWGGGGFGGYGGGDGWGGSGGGFSGGGGDFGGGGASGDW